MKDAVTRNGVLIILQNGFPVTDFGFANKSDAYSATAMAIRFWMAEQERDLNVAGSWTYLWNYNVYDTSRSGTYGTVEAISGFATLARNQAALSRARQLLTLARQAKSGDGLRGASTLTANGGTASISGNSFVFTTTVNFSNLDSGYVWRHNLPSGSSISKSSDGKTLSVTIPKTSANANKSYSIYLDGYDKAHVNNFVFAPITTDNTYQALVGISSHLGRNPVISRALTMVYLFYPEAAYGKSPFANYADSLEILNGTKGAHNSLWHYPISPFSLTGSRLHYTPLWTPDGSYDVMAQSFYAWSPVGQMYDFKSNSVTIEGDMYDRVTVVRR